MTMPHQANPDGKLAENILYFARALRGAGMKLGPSTTMDAVRAVESAGISTRDDFFWTLHCVMVTRREDHPVFEEAFHLFWRSRDLVNKMIQMFSPMMQQDEPQKQAKAAQSRVSEALFSGQSTTNETERPEIEVDARFTSSEREVLRTKDFAQMSSSEIAQARMAMANLILPENEVLTRRFKPSSSTATIDARRMISSSLKTGGDLILPQFKRQKTIHPPIVALCDISGSMSQYSRVFLHFLHALTDNRRKVETFLFGTRLTNITRALRSKDPDEALMDVSDMVDDWSGGTRIGTTLHEFNRAWSRRVLGQGAIVLLITDGLERDADDILSYEMDRLHRSCRRLIWLNPLLRFDGFEAAARGIKTMLPHVDEFRPVHSLDALSGLCLALNSRSSLEHDPKRWLNAAQRSIQ